MPKPESNNREVLAGIRLILHERLGSRENGRRGSNGR